MTTILPAERNAWDVIGKQIGQNINQPFQSGVQQGFQRQTGLNAVDQLQTASADIKKKGGGPEDMLPAIMKAYTLNPALERSGIAEKFIPLMQRTTGTGDFPAGKPHPKKTDEEDGEVVGVADLVAPRQAQGLIADPSGVGDFELPYGPEEIAQIRNTARQRGYLPELEERFVQDALQYNEIANQKHEAKLRNYQQQQQQRKDTLQNQSDFEKYVVEHSPEFTTNPDELELALKASEKHQGVKSFADRNAKVKEELRPYQAAKKALQTGLQRPLFGMTGEQRNNMRKRAQYMVDKNQKPQLQLMIANGGMGEVEEADLLNPLPEKFEENLNKFNKLVDPLSSVTNIDPESKDYQEQLERGFKRKNNQLEYMTDFLSKNIETGTYNKPGTNLLLTRKHLMDKGLDWTEAAKVIDDAIAKEKIKLDPQQQIDHQKLGYEPLRGDSYMDTVMNNLMFPITGKQ